MNPEGRSCSDGQFTKLETSKGAYLLGSNIHFSKVNQAKSVEADADCSYEVETNWVKPSITISTHSRCGKVQEDSIEKLTFTKDEINYDRFEGKSKKLVENCRYMKVKK